MRKISNQPKGYLTRAKLAGGGSKAAPVKVSPGELRQHSEREAAASIDARWYIQLAAKVRRS
jgi:hypothetical protein